MAIQLPDARSRLLKRRADGAMPLGLIVGSSDPGVTEALAVGGFDFVILDDEHAPLGPSGALQHVRAAEAAGIVPMVRVGETSQPVAQKFLDVGCQGIVFPRVESAEMAREAVATIRFAPNGVRGMCPSSHGAWYGAHDWSTYSRRSEEETLCVLLIETAAGVEAVESIAAVDGVDVLFFGIGDLSQDYGDGPGWESPSVVQAWKRLRRAVEGRETLLMTAPHPVVTTDAVRGLFDDGADMVVYSADWVLLRQTFAAITSALASQPETV